MAAGWLALCTFASVACADPQVVLNGIMGEKALVSIGGGMPRVMRIGDTVAGVRLVSVSASQAEVEQGGHRRVLSIGLGSGGTNKAGAGTGTMIIADGQGQFLTRGQVNDASTLFLIDTGASAVTVPESFARRAGVRMDSSSLIGLATANGGIPARKVLFNQVKVGDIELNMVEGIVVEDGRLPVALLGMSFLKRTNLKREGERLIISPRY